MAHCIVYNLFTRLHFVYIWIYDNSVVSNNHFFNLHLELMLLLANFISHGILYHFLYPL